MAKPFDVNLRGLEEQVRELETLRGETRSNVQRAVELTTGAVFRKARKGMRASKGGRIYLFRGRQHRASKRDEPPAIMSRHLFRSVFKRTGPLAGVVGSDEPEARWLEFGVWRGAQGGRMEKRPWLRPAVRDERKTWVRRLRRALNKATRTARRSVRERRRR